MQSFLIYDAKVAVVLLVFYLFYRFLLRKETFHRLNRIVLVGTAVLSFVLPLCIITIRRPLEIAQEGFVAQPGTLDEAIPELTPAMEVLETSSPWWPFVLSVLFFSGVAFVLVRVVVSVLSVMRLVRRGETVHEEDGCRIVVTERDIDPFSWMRYIVMSRKDWDNMHGPIVAHEMAHIRYGHSLEILLVDILSAFQWFNPAIWMLRSDLQELHEYEADDAVLRGGADIREYQYLLIRKAFGKSGYSIANSFNHSILKNRITMMSKSKSPLSRGLRALYLLPLVCLGLGLQAKTVHVPVDNGSEPLIILRQAWGDEKEISKEEFDKLGGGVIQSIELLKDAPAKEKYGDKAANGVVVVTLKKPQELNEIVVIRYGEQSDEPIPFYLLEPDTMPTFQGGDMNEFSRWLNVRIDAPKDCKHSGTMKIGFVVGGDGRVRDVKVLESVCEELDAMMVSLISKSPEWGPATDNGHPVAQYLTIPVVFERRGD